MNIPSGIPTIEAYQTLLESPVYRTLETFSNTFVNSNDTVLQEYDKRWIRDPLRTFNRQWEYPYVLQEINRYAETTDSGAMEILDAGCGITFFPFFLQQHFTKTRVTCCDYNNSFKPLFERLKKDEARARFDIQDLRELTYADNTFDIIYCISVLEHTDDYEKIICEFKRTLKPQGKLILTFDVAIDGCADIPPTEADRFLEVVDSHLDRQYGTPDEAVSIAVTKNNILSSHYIRTVDRGLLPWKHPFLSALKSAWQKKRFPKHLMKHLTFYCTTYTKTHE